jgi:hypothetical protein
MKTRVCNNNWCFVFLKGTIRFKYYLIIIQIITPFSPGRRGQGDEVSV